MDWTRAIDAYCERIGPGFWAEPLNALSNLAFILAAAILWRRTAGLIWGRVLSVILFAIGVGSGLFHSFAQAWAEVADTTPIFAFTLAYIFLAARDFLRLPGWAAGLGAVLYIPYTALLTPVFAALPFMAISSFYWPLPVLIFAFALALRGRAPGTARNLSAGAILLCLSLVARSLDMTLCAVWPLGTHFIWHLLNAVMLGWMIETWVRHVRGGGMSGALEDRARRR